MTPYFHDFTGTADWEPLSATWLGFSGTLYAHQDNASPIEIRTVGEADGTEWIAGEYNLFKSVNLAKIEIKGNGLILKAAGETNEGLR